MRLKKKPDVAEQSAKRFRDNLEAVTARPATDQHEYSRFRQLAEGLVRVPKAEIDKRRR